MTREELLEKFIRQRATKIDLTWNQFAGAIVGSGDSVKARILAAANTGDGRALFTEIAEVVKAKKLEMATEQVNTIAADDSLSIDELLGIFG